MPRTRRDKLKRRRRIAVLGFVTGGVFVAVSSISCWKGFHYADEKREVWFNRGTLTTTDRGSLTQPGFELHDIKWWGDNPFNSVVDWVRLPYVTWGSTHVYESQFHEFIHIPFGLPVVIICGLSTLLFWRSVDRLGPGHCDRCGYDLRATPDRCPECGHEPEPTP